MWTPPPDWKHTQKHAARPLMSQQADWTNPHSQHDELHQWDFFSRLKFPTKELVQLYNWWRNSRRRPNGLQLCFVCVTQSKLWTCCCCCGCTNFLTNLFQTIATIPKHHLFKSTLKNKKHDEKKQLKDQWPLNHSFSERHNNFQL